MKISDDPVPIVDLLNISQPPILTSHIFSEHIVRGRFKQEWSVSDWPINFLPDRVFKQDFAANVILSLSSEQGILRLYKTIIGYC